MLLLFVLWLIDISITLNGEEKQLREIMQEESQCKGVQQNMHNSTYDGSCQWNAKSHPEMARFGNSKAELPWEFDLQRN